MGCSWLLGHMWTESRRLLVCTNRDFHHRGLKIQCPGRTVNRYGVTCSRHDQRDSPGPKPTIRGALPMVTIGTTKTACITHVQGVTRGQKWPLVGKRPKTHVFSYDCGAKSRSRRGRRPKKCPRAFAWLPFTPRTHPGHFEVGGHSGGRTAGRCGCAGHFKT